MSDTEGSRGGQSGGVSISGQVGNVGGSIVGGDQIIGGASKTVDTALRPVADAVAAAPPEQRAQAETHLAALKQEVAKGDKADVGVVGKLVDGLVALVPGAVSALVSAFGTPLLGAVAGPASRFVLDKLRGK